MRLGTPRGMRRCILLWFHLFAAGLVLLGGKLFLIQVVHHAALADDAEEVRRLRADLLSIRGTIYDRNGVPLALSRIAHSVFADPERIDPAQHPAQKLAPILGLPVAAVEKALTSPGRFVVLRRRADDRVVKQVRALCEPRRRDGKVVPGLRGIGLKPEKLRLYPHGELAGQTLGFVLDDHTGGAGLELACERILAGRDGYVVAEVDGSRRWVIPGRRLKQVSPVRGRDVYLTIDIRIQEIAEAALRQAVQQWNAAGGTAIVADPLSGEVLALANYPPMDPNHYRHCDPTAWRNAAVTCVYEPGSTFKLIAICAALEHGVMTPETPVVTCTGSRVVGRRTIRCALHGGTRAHGALDLRGVIVKSCNIGAATIAARVGRDDFYQTLRALGFTQRTAIGLPAEAAGWVAPPQTWRDINLANLAFGQGITITPPQLLAAYCAVAAGGELPHLHLIDRIGRRDGTVQRLRYRARRALSPHTAHTVAALLRDVVSEGTGKAAQVAGFTVAGKTGTAQKPTPQAGYASGKYIGSFVGFAPAEDPRIAILVLLDEPKGSHYGGVVAAPAFADIARRTLAYLGLPPRLLAQAPQATW